ncbi:hypothetical protein KUL97_05675 [Synechococcus sp. HK05]|uniref:hypothetical protein n=1 Tax=Synechococcus sp. HK05 TaxID=2725975 RepID=UPI001C38E0F3|nr:hypothetical protein [Synechococcus sp. HK05]MBV2351199.1 hypothetical protein [Synechococcus sp. HK05]
MEPAAPEQLVAIRVQPRASRDRVLELARGASGRSKWIRVEGWSADQVRAALLSSGG